MTIKTKPINPPAGLGRLAFRAPIYMYRAGIGGLLGRRFLLLNHIGRKSGLRRQAVLEVADYDRESDTYYIASGFGPKSHWLQNIRTNPEVTIQVGWRKLAVTADILSPADSGEMMVQYARRMPKAAQSLMRLIGYNTDGSEESFRALGRDHIPFVALRPKLVLDDGKNARTRFFVIVGLAVAFFIWRRSQQ